MGLIIGMDEAGYGPNLGPLVVTVTAWEVPGDPRDVDLWTSFSEVIASTASRNGDRLQVADSKAVYTPARGLQMLERTVWCAMRLAGFQGNTFRQLWSRLIHSADSVQQQSETVPLCESPCSEQHPEPWTTEPWFAEEDLTLPTIDHGPILADFTQRWADCCQRTGIRLRAVRSDIVLTERFNRLTSEFGSKGIALSRISLNLLRHVWNSPGSEPALIIADKHGGRNRYDQLLSEMTGDALVFRLQEQRECSRYRIGSAEVRFQMKAESHFPVALASMISKYVREVSMEAFNRFWCRHLPDLKPTKGYPTDARRFRAEIADVQKRLNIPEVQLWRAR